MRKHPETVIVIPSVRPDCIQQFLDAWDPEFAGAEVIVVEDGPERTFALHSSARLTHVSWREIDRALGEDAWIVPRRSDCVRSFGFWLAWQKNPEMIVTLDDDCLPPESGPRGFLAAHWRRLEQGGAHDAWTPTTAGTIPRGVPYQARERHQRCVVNHGLWTNVIDYDAITQLAQLRQPTEVVLEERTIPRGSYYPMCGMNLAFRPEIAPAMYFLLMGRDFGIDRFGDIWCGLFSKRICDHLGWAVNSGSPTVHHARASDVWANLRKEAPGMERNETLWRLVDETVLTSRTVAGCYRQLAKAIAAAARDDDYLTRLARAMRCWARQFEIVLIPQRPGRIEHPATTDAALLTG